jgi:prenyltransferase beta subunit
MIAAARQGARLLGDRCESIAGSLARQQHDGPFLDRAGRPDLYYTIFGVEALIALSRDVHGDGLVSWLEQINPATLDLVHAAGLARIWTDLPDRSMPPQTRHDIREIIQRHRSDDGGFAGFPDCPHAGPYGSFLALGALQDLDASDAIGDQLGPAIEALRCPGGGFPGSPNGPATTPTTAAAMVVLAQLSRPRVHAGDVDWLLSCHADDGGFRAGQSTAEPDLLSTAVALFALRQARQPLTHGAADADRAFVLGLQTSEGGFRSAASATSTDCEYAFYALLALGCLGEAQ